MKARVRYMRLLVLFDLPIDTPRQRRNYAAFRRFLLKSGYLMVQKSVYSKLAINDRVASGLVSKLRENKPPEGIVQVLKVTEKQYATMECIAGAATRGFALNDTSSLVVL